MRAELAEYARQAKETGAVQVVFVTPDGAYVEIQMMEELLQDAHAGGPFLAKEFNYNIKRLREGRT